MLVGRVFPFVLVFQLCLGVLGLLDFFEVVYYPTIHRSTETLRFSLGFSLVAPMLVLMLAWCVYFYSRGSFRMLVAAAPMVFFLFGAELVVSIVSLVMFAFGLYVFEDRLRVAEVFLGVATFFNGLAVVHWGVFLPLGLGDPFEWVALLTLDLFYVFSYAAPLVVLAVLFFGVLRPLVRMGFGWASSGFLIERKEMTSRERGILVFSLLIGVFAAVYPWLPAVNPESIPFGVDIHYYLEWVGDVEGDWSRLFDVAGGSRPLMILLIMAFERLTGFDTVQAVWFMPVVLVPLMVLGVFFLAWQLFESSEVAVWSAFFTATGIQVSVGMYSYFLTNFLALALVSFSLGLFFKSFRDHSYPCLLLASFFGGLALFTHPWTFDQYFGPLLFVAFFFYYARRRVGVDGRGYRFLVLFLASLGFLEFVRVAFFGGMSGLGATQTVVESVLMYEGFWDGSIFFFRYYYGGFTSYALLFVLVLVGLFHLPEDEASSLYFRFLLGLTGLVFLFVGGPLKSRLVYNLPLGVFASLGMSVVSSRSRSPAVFQFFLVSSSLSYVFMCLANVVGY